MNHTNTSSEPAQPQPHINDLEIRKPAMCISGLRFSWRAVQPAVLEIPELAVAKGDKLFICGPSGSGKSTLLSLLAGVVTPQQGTITMLGQTITAMPAAQRDRFRGDHIGYVFQQFNLIPYLSVVDNVTLPLRFSKKRLCNAGGKTCRDEALRLLEHLGVAESGLLNRAVTELSVGQQQRVAVARALIGAPEILIADEPTSSLDACNREVFLELLTEECERSGTTVIFASHDVDLAGLFDHSFSLGGG